MADREKIIKGLEICYCPPAKCEDCPYYDLPDEQSCNDVLCLDALALLKEQPEIVRCKDCTYRGEINCPQYYRRTELSDDYFCADGKRE